MDDALSRAFQDVPRRKFLQVEVAAEANWDRALPIGYGQTNSQPTTVRLMLEWLAVQPGQKVLDVGSGSGWTSALLSHLTGSGGRVIAVERVPELVKFGESNCKRLGCKNIVFHEAGDDLGWKEDAPYERILVSATASELPTQLIDQLAPEGRMVIPVQDKLWLVTKDEQGQVSKEVYPGLSFLFVPLIQGEE